MKIVEQGQFCYDAVNRPLSGAWLTLTFAYLLTIALIGVFLALRIRKVKFKALKNSRYIVAVIYVSFIALIVICVSVFALGNLPNIIELLISGSLMVITAVFLAMVFIPKVSKKNKIFSTC